MMKSIELEQLEKRLTELAIRSEKTGQTVFTGFLSPQELILAKQSAQRSHLVCSVFGGFKYAERCVAAFDENPIQSERFPIGILEIHWPHQDTPRHQDLLGAVLGLGLSRSCIGDIVIESERAYLFCESNILDYLVANYTSAGKSHLQIIPLEQTPDIEPASGETVHRTVASLRLDAIISAGFHMSRGDAAQMISQGLVKRNHLPELRNDAKMYLEDVVSVRGYGRIQIDAIGNPTKKNRLPLTLTRYGTSK